jgi:hypothetical protein
MEYRDVQYTLEEDGLGGCQWAVVLVSPPEIETGHAAIDRVLGSRRFRRVQIGTAHAVILGRNDSRFRD